MKQPLTPLPWVITPYQENEKYEDSVDKYKVVPLKDQDKEEWEYEKIMCNRDYYNTAPEKQDAEYIVEACNNYPTAIRYIERLLEFLNGITDNEYLYSPKFGSTPIKEIEKFLKSINNGTETH